MVESFATIEKNTDFWSWILILFLSVNSELVVFVIDGQVSY